MDDLERVPRVEFGRWERHAVSAVPADEVRYDDRKAAFGSHFHDIQLTRDRKLVARRPREQAPLNPWGAPGAEALAFSGDGRWLWHLGYQDAHAHVTLFDGKSLKPIGTHTPMKVDRYNLREEPIREWCELTAKTCAAAPDVLLAYANAGDSFALLITLQATLKGIVDPVGTTLYNTVADRLDQTLCSANFLAADRLLILDDIGQLTLFSWPEIEPLEFYSVLEGLRDEDYEIHLWPGDDEVWVVVGEEMGIVGDLLLVNIYDRQPPHALRALVALDVATLSPRGLIRPPQADIGQLTHLGQMKFGAVHQGRLHSWHLRLL